MKGMYFDIRACGLIVVAATSLTVLCGGMPPEVVQSHESAKQPVSRDGASSRSSAKRARNREVDYRNLLGEGRFVGSEACAPCHRKIYDEYLRTPHAQAATLPAERPELRNLPAEGTSVCEKDGQQCFRVFPKDGEYYMSKVERDSSGTETVKESHKIDFALGAPLAGIGYGIRRGNYLFEAPLSYYAGSQDTHPNGWGLSPGYEKASLGFSRPLVGSCMYCHVGRELVVDDANNLYPDLAISELKVGCENCHGPGGLHVEEQEKHIRVAGRIDTSIVNPRYLSPRVRDDMCIYCHEFGEARVPQPGKRFEDFRAGQPLLDTMAIFKTRPIMGWNMMEWSDEMAQSKCYRASGGRLNCESCHDGHATPTAAEAPAFYRGKCLHCHQETSCGETVAKRQTTMPADDCATCHMPKHVAPRFVMLGTQGTSHRIVKHVDEPIPLEVVREQSPDPNTGLILVNNKEGAKPPAIAPIMLLQAYQAVLARSPKRDDLVKRYDLLLDQLSKSEPDNLLVLSALAKRELEKRSAKANGAALEYLSRAVERGSNTPQDHMLLAELLFRSNRKEEAIKILKNAISKFPFVPTAYENLSFCYLSMGDDAHARQIVQQGLAAFPEDSNLLGIQRKLGITP